MADKAEKKAAKEKEKALKKAQKEAEKAAKKEEKVRKAEEKKAAKLAAKLAKSLGGTKSPTESKESAHSPISLPDSPSVGEPSAPASPEVQSSQGEKGDDVDVGTTQTPPDAAAPTNSSIPVPAEGNGDVEASKTDQGNSGISEQTSQAAADGMPTGADTDVASPVPVKDGPEYWELAADWLTSELSQGTPTLTHTLPHTLTEWLEEFCTIFMACR